MFFVSLKLFVGLPHIGVQVGRVLEFQQHQGQAVDEQDDVGPARVPGATNRELVDRQPVVGLRLGPVDQPHEVAARFTIHLVLHRHARHQQAVEMPVGGQQRRNAQVEHLRERIVPRGWRNAGVQPLDRRAQPPGQQHLPEVAPFRRLAVGRQVGTVGVAVAHILQPGQGFLFELVFGHAARFKRFHMSVWSCQK